uniref:Uncharacterized protein n=1 Tax=Oryza nivara TaxID=4536 RepID=A0A0E0G6V2_ORYNI
MGIGVNHVTGEELQASRDEPFDCRNHLQLHHQHRERGTGVISKAPRQLRGGGRPPQQLVPRGGK